MPMLDSTSANTEVKMKKRTLYQAPYRATLNDPDPVLEPTDDQSNTSKDGTPATPEEETWKKRYSDLRSHSSKQISSLTERIKGLETDIRALSQKEIKIPSSQEEIASFARQYPDIYRHIRTIAMTELLQEKNNYTQETEQVKENLEDLKMELGLAKILKAHPDFHELNGTPEFNNWAMKQPQIVQDWLFRDSDPDNCIQAIDYYKAELALNKPPEKPKRKSTSAAEQINTKGSVETPDDQTKKIWKGSEIQKMHPKLYEKYEDEIELARIEGRIDLNA